MLAFLILGFSATCMAEDSRDDGSYSVRKMAAIAIVAESLAVWGAYELGSDTESSQRNVKILLGVQLGWMLGLLMGPGEAAPPKNLALYVEPSGLGFNYKY